MTSNSRIHPELCRNCAWDWGAGTGVPLRGAAAPSLPSFFSALFSLHLSSCSSLWLPLLIQRLCLGWPWLRLWPWPLDPLTANSQGIHSKFLGKTLSGFSAFVWVSAEPLQRGDRKSQLNKSICFLSWESATAALLCKVLRDPGSLHFVIPSS